MRWLQHWFVSWGRSSANIFRQRAGEMIEQKPNPAARPQVVVHDEPHFEVKLDLIRKHRDKVRAAAGESSLAYADSEPRAEGGKLGQVAVAAIAKDVRGQRATRNGESAESACIPVHSDELVLENLGRIRRQPPALRIAAVGV